VPAYETFLHHGARYRICCPLKDRVCAEIVHQRSLLEAYIARHAEFHEAYLPVETLPDAPSIARRMAAAAARVGEVGPMAAVAGAMAEFAGCAALDAGADSVIIENGGDLFMKTQETITVGLYSGESGIRDQLAFRVDPAETPLAICSSSRMGHSTSLGNCDLATVVAHDTALADAAATHAANCVKVADDIAPTLDAIMLLEGVTGVLIAQGEQLGMAGTLPDLVRAGQKPM